MSQIGVCILLSVSFIFEGSFNVPSRLPSNEIGILLANPAISVAIFVIFLMRPGRTGSQSLCCAVEVLGGVD